MAANYSEELGLEEYSDSFNDSFEAFDANQTLHSVNEYGFVHIFDESTSNTIQFVLVGLLLTIVGFLGVVGNILSILVLSQKKIHASLTILLIGLSLCDLFVCVLLIALKGLPALFKPLHFGLIYSGWICSPKKVIHPILQTGKVKKTKSKLAQFM